MIRKTRRKYRQNSRKKNTAGFTLSELLIVVGILAVLAAIGMVALFTYQKSLKLNEMDSTAKQIFVAAQNHMTAEKASGEWDKLEDTHAADVAGTTDENGYFGMTMSETNGIEAPTDFPDVAEAGFAWDSTGIVKNNDDKVTHHFYYIVYTPGSDDLQDTILKDMLPFGAIDEDVRSDVGSYVIEYDYKTASVYGVFYTDKQEDDFIEKEQDLANDDGRTDKDVRKSSKPIIGYYGGAAAKKMKSSKISDPNVKVINEDKLIVDIKDVPDEVTNVTVSITGEESKNTQKYMWTINKENNLDWWEVDKTGNKVESMKLTLDDITKVGNASSNVNHHFYNLFCNETLLNKTKVNKNKALIPGENITVRVKYSSTTTLSNITKTDAYTNSLFESCYEKGTSGSTTNASATVANIRHLQNLDPEVSGLEQTAGKAKSSTKLKIEEISQTKDLNWNESWKNKQITSKSGENVVDAGEFAGVINESFITYDGQGHKIENLNLGVRSYGEGENKPTYSGLFPVAGLNTNIAVTIENLNLVDIKSAGDTTASGALVGCIYGSGPSGSEVMPTIANVGVYDSSAETYKASNDDDSRKIESASGMAGGLIGVIGSKDGENSDLQLTVENCFASVPVETESGAAGGLIGGISRNNTLITNSYSGGHTEEATYNKNDYNVAATSNNGTRIAGGLIGAKGNGVSDVIIRNSYSTCSVYGNIAGGFVGVDGDGSAQYTNCYATGLTSGPDGANRGAFAGHISDDSTMTTSYYLSGINSGLSPFGNSTDTTVEGKNYADLGNAAWTDTTSSKPTQVTGDSLETVNYDSALNEVGAYPFATVNKTAATKNGLTAVHYGDWPEQNDTFEGTLAYYELYRNNGSYQLGLYNGSMNLNTLSDGAGEIVQDGYVALSEKQSNVMVDGDECVPISSFVDDNNTIENILPVLNDSVQASNWSSGNNALADDSTLTVTVNDANKLYYLYFMQLQTIDKTSTNTFYREMKVTAGNGDEGKSFWLNPHYAKSNIGESVITPESAGAIELRTERQYSMFTQDLQNPMTSIDANPIFEVYQGKAYNQTKDLDFSNSSKYTSSYFGTNTTGVTNESTVAAMIPIPAAGNTPLANNKQQDTIGFRGTYDGQGHSISNLTLTAEAGKTSGMFGNTQGAVIRNINLNNVHVNGNNYVGSLIGSAAHAMGASNAYYSRIENVTINNATLTGDKFVGGLIGAAYSCSVNSTNANNQVVLNNISATGNAVVGGAFGIITNYGNQVKGGFTYQNISLTGSNVIEETSQHKGTTNTSAVGTGGFAGQIYAINGATARAVRFSNINISNEASSATTIRMGNDATKNNVYVGTFVGNFDAIENISAGRNGAFAFTNCAINNTLIELNGANKSSGSYGVGGVFGYVGEKITYSLTTEINYGGNCTIKDANTTNCEYKIGDWAGIVKADVDVDTKRFFETANRLKLENINTINTSSLGRLAGSLLTGGTVSGNGLQTDISMPNATAQNIGGVVGSVSGTIQHAAIDTIAGTISNDQEANCFIGGVTGSVESGGTVNDIHIVGKIQLTALGNTQTSLGGCVGLMSGGSLSDITVMKLTNDVTNLGHHGGIIGVSSAASASNCSISDLAMTGSADYAGGFVGLANGLTASNCNVRSATLGFESTKAVKNEDGDYLINNQISPFKVSSTKVNASVGGFAGRLMASDISKSFAAIPVRGYNTGMILGGFSGVNESSSVYESYASCNVINQDYSEGSRTGGFVGRASGQNEIFNCYATGDVKKGSIVAGFVADLPDKSLAYLNKCYSLGMVDQQINQDKAVTKHGGFVGNVTGKLTTETIGLSNVEVGKFYQLLELDLVGIYNGNITTVGDAELTDAEKEICNKCLHALYRRINSGVDFEEGDDFAAKMKGCKSVSDYLVKVYARSIDSTAAKQASAGLNAGVPSAAAIVDAMFEISEFKELPELVKTWRLDVDKSKLLFYYSAIDVANEYSLDEVNQAVVQGSPYAIVCYRFEKGEEGYLQTKGTISLKQVENSSNYGKYVVLSSDFMSTADPEPVQTTDELKGTTYTGCAYLKDDVTGYNICTEDNPWSDDIEELKKSVIPHSYDEFTDANSDFFKTLNESQNSQQKDKYQMVATKSVPYDKSIGKSYRYPALVDAVGYNTLTGTHIGDWPVKPEQMGIVYYEKIENPEGISDGITEDTKDVNLYYHGYAKSNYGTTKELKPSREKLEDGLLHEPSNYVTEDGYLIVVLKNTVPTNVTVGFGASDQVTAKLDKCATQVPETDQIIKRSELAESYDLYYLDFHDAASALSKFDEGAVQVQISNGNLAMNQQTFAMTPNFADSVATEISPQTTYKIRSARQLLKLQTLTQYAQNPLYTFVQGMDIDYSVDVNGNNVVPFTEQNKAQLGAMYTYNNPIATMSANYKVDKIEHTDESAGSTVINGYQIKGITTCMFGNIGSTSVHPVIQGMTLTDVQAVDTNKDGVAFAKNNFGTIDSCTVRPSENNYSSVLISRSGKNSGNNGLATSGFIWTNQKAGVIKNSSFIGTVELRPNSSVEWANVSGFVDVNIGKVSKCYTNCNLNIYKTSDTITSTIGSASGFCQSNRDNGVIEDSHAISMPSVYYDSSSISSRRTYGIGFVNVNGDGALKPGIIRNSYSVIRGENVVDLIPFAKDNQTGSTLGSDNYYMNREEGYNGNNSGSAQGKTYNQMKEQATSDNAVASSGVTHPYDNGLEGHAYPFSLPSAEPYITMQHYGDWPEQNVTFDVGMTYYEVVSGKGYYHGYTTDYATEETAIYEEIQTTGEGLENGLVTGNDKYVTDDGYLVMIPKQITSIGNLQIQYGTNSFETVTTNMLSASGVPEDIANEYSNYNVYKLLIPDGPILNSGKYTSQYASGLNTIALRTSSNSANTAAFRFSPHFADSIRIGSTVTSNTYKIRSGRQLNNLQSVSAFSNNQNYEFIQELNINGSGLSSPIATLNATLRSATYTSNGKTEGYVIDGLKINLINTVGGTGKVKGITLTNLKASAQAGFAVRNSAGGVIESCSIRPKEDGKIEDVTLSGTSGDGAGFVYTNTGTISDCYIVGLITYNPGVFQGATTAGFVYTNSSNAVIENCYSNVRISISKQSSADWATNESTGFCYINDGTIQGSHCLGSVNISHTSGSTGTGYGFVKTNTNNASIINCYSAMDTISATTKYTFAGSTPGNTNGCYYLTTSGVSGTTNGAEGKTYQQMQKVAEDEGTYTTADRTHRFTDTLPEAYPFELPYTQKPYTTMQHYGDWIAYTEPTSTTTVGLVYYEVIDGVTYYHGYNQDGVEISSTNADGTIGLSSATGRYVAESGYMLLSNNEITNGANNVFYYDSNSSSNERITSVFSLDASDPITGLKAYKLNANRYSSFKNNGNSNVKIAIKLQGESYTYNYAMTPYFADSVQYGSTTETTYYIRTVEQLNNLCSEDISGFAQDKAYTFVQKCDLDFSNAGLNASIEEFEATYKSGIYYDEWSNRCGYTIKGIDKPLFDTIGSDGKVYNVTIIDSHIRGRAGFVVTNEGIIDSCVLRPSGKQYDQMVVENTGDVAGVVINNFGTITNSYFIGMVSAENKAMGFVLHNGDSEEGIEGYINSCYTNVTLFSEGKDISGFCDDSEDSIISNSHVLIAKGSKTTAKQNVYGFIRRASSAKLSNCYVAMDENITGKINTFADNNLSSTSRDSCCYLSTYIPDDSNKTGVARTYMELENQVNDNAATTSTTHRFDDMLLTVYPFALTAITTDNRAPLTTQHYGDWPAEPEAEAYSLSEEAVETASVMNYEAAGEITEVPVNTGIAYHETNSQGYDGWYAITDGASNDNAPFNTLTIDKNVNIAGADTSYGILISSGVVPKSMGAKIEDEPAATVSIDSIDYDYYKFETDKKHEDITVTVKTEKTDDTSTAYTYNDDFAAAVSAGKTLGVTAEEGGRPYQIRTNEQLRNINKNKEVYTTKAYRQTLDIALSSDEFEPIGGVSIWTKDGVYSFTGSYDAGLIRAGRDMLETSADETADSSEQVPDGYHILGLNQTMIFTSVDGNNHTDTGEDKESMNDKYKILPGGLFASVDGTVRGVNVSGNINVVTDTAVSYLQGSIGSVAGEVTEHGLVANTNSDVTISVDAQCIGLNLGGVIGYNDGHIQNSYYNGFIQNYYYDENHSGQLTLQNEAGYTAKIGGFVGCNTGVIDKSSTAAIINLKTENAELTAPMYGGFAGWSYDKDSSITNSWSKSMIIGASGTIGGFVGAVDAQDDRHMTVLTDDYAITRIDNPRTNAIVGLFAGRYSVQSNPSNSEPNIWSCFAAEMNADNAIVASSYPFVNGDAFNVDAHNCFVWNRVDEIPFATLNVTSAWNLNNSIYPTLIYNVEREKDVVIVRNAISAAKEQLEDSTQPELVTPPSSTTSTTTETTDYDEPADTDVTENDNPDQMEEPVSSGSESAPDISENSVGKSVETGTK